MLNQVRLRRMLESRECFRLPARVVAYIARDFAYTVFKCGHGHKKMRRKLRAPPPPGFVRGCFRSVGDFAGRRDASDMVRCVTELRLIVRI